MYDIEYLIKKIVDTPNKDYMHDLLARDAIFWLATTSPYPYLIGIRACKILMRKERVQFSKYLREHTDSWSHLGIGSEIAEISRPLGSPYFRFTRGIPIFEDWAGWLVFASLLGPSLLAAIFELSTETTLIYGVLWASYASITNKIKHIKNQNNKIIKQIKAEEVKDNIKKAEDWLVDEGWLKRTWLYGERHNFFQ